MNKLPSTSEILNESLERSEEYMRENTELCEAFGDSPEKTKNEQERALVNLYRKQLITSITIYCLVRQKGLKGLPKNHQTSLTTRSPAYVEEMGQLSEINTEKIIDTFYFLEDEIATKKLQEIMDQIHQNCSLIARKMGIEFNETQKEIGKT